MKNSSKIIIVKLVVLLNLILFLGIVFVPLAVASVSSADFSWVKSPEPSVVGYKIYYGTTAGGPYPDFVDISSNVPSSNDGRIHGTVTGLSDGITYYFVCKAYDDLGNESAFSSEVVYLEAPLSAAPIIKTIKIN